MLSLCWDCSLCMAFRVHRLVLQSPCCCYMYYCLQHKHSSEEAVPWNDANLMKRRKGSGPRGIPCSDVALILYIIWCRERRGDGLTACCRKVLAESCIAISLSCCVDRRSGTVEGRDNGQSQDSKDTPSLPAHARQWDLQEKPS